MLISCVTACGRCSYCKIGLYAHCENGGWIFGHLIDGTQAELVRVPYADNSLYHVPEGADEQALVMLSDILPTGFEIGVLNGKVKPGDTVAMEAVGIPATFNICQNLVKPGGHIANVGVHGKPVQFDIDRLWIKNITLTTGLVSTNTTPMLLKTVHSGRLKPEQLITHRFKLDDIMQAYEVFGNAAKEKAIKVILSNA